MSPIELDVVTEKAEGNVRPRLFLIQCDGIHPIANRGLKPTATRVVSLRDNHRTKRLSEPCRLSREALASEL